MVLSLLAHILFSMATLHLCRVFGLGISPEGAGMGKGKRFLQGLWQHGPRRELLRAPLLIICEGQLSGVRWGYSHLVSRVKWLVAESKSEHKNKVILEICLCCIFSKLLLNMWFGPGSFCLALDGFWGCFFSSCCMGS